LFFRVIFLQFQGTINLNFIKFAEPNPAVRYKLFSQNTFFYKAQRASVGRFSASRKKGVFPQKAFHFHQGQEIVDLRI
jgi:hypothetical protein